MKDVKPFSQDAPRAGARVALRIPVGLVVAGDGLTRPRKSGSRVWMYNPALTSEYGNAKTPALGWFRRALASAGGRVIIMRGPPKGRS